MEQSKLKSDSVTSCRKLKSSNGRGKGPHSPKCKPSESNGDEGCYVTKSFGEGNSSQPPAFGLARRAAICSVIEEVKLHNGIPLSELRKDLILRYRLIKIGLL